MANKTRPNKTSVRSFLAAIDDDGRRADCKAVAAIMRRVTGKPATMWGTSMVGFGKYRYKYESGREGDAFLTGFAPRKQALTIYVMDGFSGYDALMKRLGKYKTGKSCLYVKRLDDIDRDVLEQLLTRSVRHMRRKYGV